MATEEKFEVTGWQVHIVIANDRVEKALEPTFELRCKVASDQGRVKSQNKLAIANLHLDM